MASAGPPEFPPMVDRGLGRCVAKKLVFMARSSQGVKFAREARSACCLNNSHRKLQRSLHRLSALSISIIVLLSLGRPSALGLLVGFCVPLLRLCRCCRGVSRWFRSTFCPPPCCGAFFRTACHSRGQGTGSSARSPRVPQGGRMPRPPTGGPPLPREGAAVGFRGEEGTTRAT